MSDAGMSEVERQNMNVTEFYHKDIMKYQRELEEYHLTGACLEKHQITASLRARMVDWMIEVLTNFKCDDQTFFLSVSLLDRYLKNQPQTLQINDLHLMGVTCMYIGSKYEDI